MGAIWKIDISSTIFYNFFKNTTIKTETIVLCERSLKYFPGFLLQNESKRVQRQASLPREL